MDSLMESVRAYVPTFIYVLRLTLDGSGSGSTGGFPSDHPDPGHQEQGNESFRVIGFARCVTYLLCFRYYLFFLLLFGWQVVSVRLHSMLCWFMLQDLLVKFGFGLLHCLHHRDRVALCTLYFIIFLFY